MTSLEYQKVNNNINSILGEINFLISELKLLLLSYSKRLSKTAAASVTVTKDEDHIDENDK